VTVSVCGGVVTVSVRGGVVTVSVRGGVVTVSVRGGVVTVSVRGGVVTVWVSVTVLPGSDGEVAVSAGGRVVVGDVMVLVTGIVVVLVFVTLLAPHAGIRSAQTPMIRTVMAQWRAGISSGQWPPGGRSAVVGRLERYACKAKPGPLARRRDGRLLPEAVPVLRT
jgi:hypothetical protein